MLSARKPSLEVRHFLYILVDEAASVRVLLSSLAIMPFSLALRF